MFAVMPLMLTPSFYWPRFQASLQIKWKKSGTMATRATNSTRNSKTARALGCHCRAPMPTIWAVQSTSSRFMASAVILTSSWRESTPLRASAFDRAWRPQKPPNAQSRFFSTLYYYFYSIYYFEQNTIEPSQPKTGLDQISNFGLSNIFFSTGPSQFD